MSNLNLVSLTELAQELGYSPGSGRLRGVCRELEVGRKLSGYYLTKGEAAQIRRHLKEKPKRRPRGPTA